MVLKTEDDYKAAIERLQDLLDIDPDSDEEEYHELNIIGDAIADYERDNYPIELPTVPEQLRFCLDQWGINQTQLGQMLGLQRSHMSEILNGKRELPLRATKLAYKLGIPAVVLLQTDEMPQRPQPSRKDFQWAESVLEEIEAES